MIRRTACSVLRRSWSEVDGVDWDEWLMEWRDGSRDGLKTSAGSKWNTLQVNRHTYIQNNTILYIASSYFPHSFW